MARETNLIDSAVDVAEVIHGYARKKGWVPGSYHIEMIVHTDFFTLSIFLFADFLISEEDEQTIYDDLFDRIQRKYKKHGCRPYGFNSFGMIVAGAGDFRKDYIPCYENAIYVDSALLNPPLLDVAH